ncbi:MAG: hypothetical protein A2060_05300 [Planctomycetes bacterium GWA2_50_13]|nr:MAG: hypothetical protein A2060_05300 [Planctomycetes bacterium GWA2_50_13]OHB92693.1 MAG: hypothetical protein A3E75_02870 [Planctomycetes bacterium RIFCSPHIGHO2_12_FULL_51_37]OHB94949.1 MAG: hypothetical protein A3I59_01470 [Planctomycetes bacterium RIFCSPLOWO2_02_FULL_50_16]
MLWNRYVPIIVCAFLLIFVSKSSSVFCQETDNLEAAFARHRLAMAEIDQEGSRTADPPSTDVQAELTKLRDEMSRMKRSYDLKLNEVEEKLATIEEEKERHNWGKLETLPNVRPAALKEGTTPEEKAKTEDEFKELMGEESAPGKGLTYPPVAKETPRDIFGIQLRPGGVSQSYNPDISVIGDFLGTFINPGRGLLFEDGGFADNEFADRFAFREVELGLQSVIDPYARADFFLEMDDAKDFKIEEAYLTLLTLPYGIQPKVGMFRSAFGKVNRTHRPELFQADYPNVVKNLLGEEGLTMTGLSISWLVPNPWDRWIELTGEVSTPTARDAMYLMHLKSFHELTPNSVLEVGLTGATGVLPEGLLADNQRRVDMEGFNITYKWKPVTERLKPYRSFLWQTEFIASQPHNISETTEVTSAGDTESIKQRRRNAWGAYTFGEYQLTRRNFAGLRFDYSQFLTVKDGDYEWAVSPYWTFWQSDFARYRLTYTHTKRHIANGPGSDDSIMLQATFSIGVHRPHPF